MYELLLISMDTDCGRRRRASLNFRPTRLLQGLPGEAAPAWFCDKFRFMPAASAAYRSACVGVAWSHYRAYELVCEERLQNVVILEDDARLVALPPLHRLPAEPVYFGGSLATPGPWKRMRQDFPREVEEACWLRLRPGANRVEGFSVLGHEAIYVPHAAAAACLLESLREARDLRAIDVFFRRERLVRWLWFPNPFAAGDPEASQVSGEPVLRDLYAAGPRRIARRRERQTAMACLVLDGGCGRELLAIGAPFRQPEWSALALMEAPACVAEVHRRFVAAGCDVLTTNSYALVPYHLGAAFEARGAELADLAGRLAREAAAPGVRVAGSLPPVAGSYRPEAFDEAETRRVLAVLLAALEPHVDLWLIETQSSLAEAGCACAATRALSAKPIWLSFTVDDACGSRLRGGETLAAAAQAAARWGVEALLVNCSACSATSAALATLAATTSGLRYGAYANALPPREPDTPEANAVVRPACDVSPEAYAAWARGCRALGASILGGCCGVGAAHVAALRALCDEAPSGTA